MISAHSGMNRAQMFSDLSELNTGDIILIHVLDETLTYEVCDKAVILPEDTQALVPEKDRDLVSLGHLHALWHQYAPAGGHRREDR